MGLGGGRVGDGEVVMFLGVGFCVVLYCIVLFCIELWV